MGSLLSGSLSEEVAHFLLCDVYGRHHDVAWLRVHELNDALAEVGFHHLNAVFLEERVHLTLLGEHRLALDHLFNVVLAQNLQYSLVELLCVLCPVDDNSVFLGIGCEEVEIVVHVCYGVSLYVACHLS